MTAKSKPEMRWQRKDLLGIRELSAEEITFILDTADAFKEVGTREIKKVPALRGKTLVNFFVEPSTRTRTSFELAAIRLSADVINISAASSSLSPETTYSSLRRHTMAGKPPSSSTRRCGLCNLCYFDRFGQLRSQSCVTRASSAISSSGP